MSENIYNETLLIQNIYQEYLEAVNRYKNLKRPSCFIKYYNIDYDLIPHHDQVDSTYDTYTYSSVLFNLYEFTPAFYIAPINNTSTNVTDLTGQMMDGNTSLVVYSIDRPRFNDIVAFYDPIKTGEIFRVVNFRTPMNAVRSDPTTTWYELDLEYAPKLDLTGIKLNNTYYYDLSLQSYLEQQKYLDRLEYFSNLETYFNSAMIYYNEIFDLYKVDNLIPIACNELFIYYKKFRNHDYHRVFESFKSPYGYLDILNMQYSSINDLPFDDFEEDVSTHVVYNTETSQIEQYTLDKSNWEESSDINNLFYLSYRIAEEYSNYIVSNSEN